MLVNSAILENVMITCVVCPKGSKTLCVKVLQILLPSINLYHIHKITLLYVYIHVNKAPVLQLHYKSEAHHLVRIYFSDDLF